MNHRLNDFNRQIDDFNYRLKLLEQSSIKKQQRKVVFEHNANKTNHFPSDIRY